MNQKRYTLSAIVILLSLLLSSCGGAAGTGLSGSEVTFDISVIEIKGATDGISAPDIDPQTLSAGYRFKPPGEYDADNPDKWQVSTYLFSPAEIVVVQGDTVTLRIFVINGDHHGVWLEAPDGSKVDVTVSMERGRQYTFTFSADQAGYYTLHCDDHAPTMSAIILSLP